MSNLYKKPNTFFVGAPKCGTTAMAQYLDNHPDIYVSKPKEPDWFVKGEDKSEFSSEEEYLRICFTNRENHQVVIDANIMALSTNGAIQRILDFNPEAKFIIMIRNPVDASYSFYSHLISRNKEKAGSFEKAWSLQDRRAKGEILPVPKEQTHYHMWQYGSLFKYGKQIERLFSQVKKDRVQIIKFSKFTKNPRKAYKKVLSFFGLPHIINTEFPKVNQDSRNRFEIYNKAIDYLGNIKRKIGIPYLNTGIFSALYSLNSRKHERPPLDENFRQELQEYFAEDAKKLKKLTGINIFENEK